MCVRCCPLDRYLYKSAHSKHYFKSQSGVTKKLEGDFVNKVLLVGNKSDKYYSSTCFA